VVKTSENNTALKILGVPKAIEGFIHGMKYPSLLLVLQGQGEYRRKSLTDLNQLFSSRMDNAGPLELPEDAHWTETAALSMLNWMGKLYRSEGVPVFEDGLIIGAEPAGSVVMIAVPTLSFLHKETHTIFSWLLGVVNLALTEGNYHAVFNELDVIKKQLAPASSKQKNTDQLLKTSLQRGIPAVSVAGDIYQYGYGSRARLLESTFTDVTSASGTRLARSKTSASRLLRLAGIPVPDQRIVRTIGEAEAAALELGFPVVVKPADLDGGVGVAAGIDTLEELREAYANAERVSSNIILEKHCEGRDFRLLVFQDELIFAVERVPGGVTGDGKSTVLQLVEETNKDPNRGDGNRTILKKLELDDEAILLLRKKGMDTESIPVPGEFVKLRRTANIASGGSGSIEFGTLHPDNAELAIRAARLLGLDLAGIDLLIPDISKSWMECGGVICEINAQPGLGGITSSHLYGQLLEALVEGNGRIPVCVIIGAPHEWDLARKTAGLLGAEGFAVGIADRNGVQIGTDLIHGPASAFDAGLMLLMERTVDAVLLDINDTKLLGTGLPFERFDLLVLAGSNIDVPSQTGDEQKLMLIQAMLDFIVPCCDGRIIVVDGPGAEVLETLLPVKGGLDVGRIKESATSSEIFSAMLAAGSRHRQPCR
jgi:cyanophycin synthetase